MNKVVVIDSSALVSLAIPTDSNNKKAKEISRYLKRAEKTVCVPGDVCSETINVIGKKAGHEGAVRIGRNILLEKEFLLREITFEIRLVAFNKFIKQPRNVSFTDCLVMAMADEFETKDIFGFDEAFRKNGYRRIGID